LLAAALPVIETSRFRERKAQPPAKQAGKANYIRHFDLGGFSMTAPVASGWSGCRVGLAPTGKRRLVTAHAKSTPYALQQKHPYSGRKAGANSATTC